MKPDQIIFYNPANNGDIHVSRGLVKKTMELLPNVSFTYSHRNNPALLRDIKGLTHRSLLETFNGDAMSRSEDEGRTLIWNTWYAVSPSWGKGRGSGITLFTLYELFRAHLRSIGITLDVPEKEVVPSIDFSCFHTIRTARYFLQLPKFSKRILICNNPVASGQSKVRDEEMNDLVRSIATDHPDVFVVYTSPIEGAGKFSALSAEIIGKTLWGNDLNETAYLATQCDVIVGRSSGPHTFCLNQNILNDPSKSIVTFVDSESLANWTKSAARKYWTPNTDLASLREVVAASLA